MTAPTISYLNALTAKRLDDELMGDDIGYSVDQLMELAGLAVAQVVAEVYPLTSFSRVLVIAGPGNNGGDGLVAARHLTQFGYSVTVLYPIQTNKPLYVRLLKQLWYHKVQVSTELPDFNNLAYNLVIDAMFGFSFKGPIRSPFDVIIEGLSRSAAKPVILSVDIPSGWNVDTGPNTELTTVLQPDTLVSLTLPKSGVRSFNGIHYVGGRFVPNTLREKYQLLLPAYPGHSQICRIA